MYGGMNGQTVELKKKQTSNGYTQTERHTMEGRMDEWMDGQTAKV